MRIMHISTRLILGGSQENTILSCMGQVDEGHAVSLVFGPIYGPEGSLRDRAEAQGGIEMIETHNLVRELAPIRDYRCYGDLKQIIRRWKPDIVHTHSSKAGIIGRAAAWKLGVPCVVHTIHGLPFHPYEKAWRNAIYIASERWAARRCHRIACVADAMRDQALAKGIGQKDQFVTVYSGMEVETYLQPQLSSEEMRKKLGLRQEDFVIGTVSRLAEHKGHDDILDALGEELLGNPSMKLLWVGDGRLRERLEKRINELGIENQVILTGLVQAEAIASYIAAMDLLVHPSYHEGLPRAVVQALLGGKPVVANDVDGTREVCIPDKTGYLIGVGDHEALRKSVIELRDNPEKRTVLGNAGRLLCKEKFAASKMVQNLDTLYRKVLVR
ncbi:MAG: glycosyltransferase family 4 protein [Phycisphaerales bacterium]|nr:glycosyltransferase family 4 protein [Phycisphaerales bacterium]